MNEFSDVTKRFSNWRKYWIGLVVCPHLGQPASSLPGCERHVPPRVQHVIASVQAGRDLGQRFTTLAHFFEQRAFAAVARVRRDQPTGDALRRHGHKFVEHRPTSFRHEPPQLVEADEQGCAPAALVASEPMAWITAPVCGKVMRDC